MSDTKDLVRVLLSEEADLLQKLMQPVELHDGQVLFMPGDPGDAFYVIDSGQVCIFIIGQDGQRRVLNTLGPNEAFGEIALVDDQPRTAGAVAVGPARLRRLSRQDFMAMVHTSPALTKMVIGLLSQRNRHMTDYIERLSNWAQLVAEGQYDQAMKNIREARDTSDRALAAVISAVESMVQKVEERESRLKKEVSELRIQIDEAKRARQVAEIVETDYFQELTRKAKDLRKKT